MRLLDEHWIVFPTFVTGGRTRLERFKMRFFPEYTVRQFDTLFPPSDPEVRSRWLAERGLGAGDYVVFVPGGRGEGHLVEDPAELFVQAARRVVAATGQTTVVLTGRKSVATSGDVPALRLLPRIGPEEVQHLLAEARCLMEGAFSAALYPAWAVDQLEPAEARAAGRVAKAYCVRAARTVCETAVQVHGGIGNTWDCIVHVHLRRALLSSQWFGDDGEQLRQLERTRLGVHHGLS